MIERDSYASLGKNRIELMSRICNNEGIAKCLVDASRNFESHELTDDEIDSLPYTYVFPFPTTTDTSIEKKTYITMNFQYKKSKGTSMWKLGYISFLIFCDKSIQRTAYGILRCDYILQEIDKMMIDSRNDTWLGHMEPDSCQDVIIDEGGKFVGIRVTYKVTEFT